MDFRYALLLLLGVFISAISQVMLKKAALKTYDSRIREYLNPLVICAYVLFVCTTFLSIFAYKGIPLSMGPLLEATSYIYVTIFGITIFHEKCLGGSGYHCFLFCLGSDYIHLELLYDKF